MKKILLLICLLALTGCGHNEHIGELKVSKADIVKVEDLKNGDVAYYYAGKSVPANTYKVMGKEVKEDISKRTSDTETYCDGKVCVMKQYFSEKYSKSDVFKELLMATTTKTEIDSVLAGFLGDTNTGSTNNKDNFLDGSNKNTNNGENDNMAIGFTSSQPRRPIINFTLSSGSGTISSIKLYCYQSTSVQTNNVNAHALTRTNWTETGSTWNKYDGTNNWTTAGGDYNSSIIDVATLSNLTASWNYWVLMGTGSDNPLTLTWGDEVNILLKGADESGDWVVNLRTRHYSADTSKRPYIEITYTAPSTSSFIPTPLIIN